MNGNFNVLNQKLSTMPKPNLVDTSKEKMRHSILQFSLENERKQNGKIIQNAIPYLDGLAALLLLFISTFGYFYDNQEVQSLDITKMGQLGQSALKVIQSKVDKGNFPFLLQSKQVAMEFIKTKLSINLPNEDYLDIVVEGTTAIFLQILL
jgi:hypothetical protein